MVNGNILSIGIDESGNANLGKPFVVVAAYDEGIESLFPSDQIRGKGRPIDQVRAQPSRKLRRRKIWQPEYKWTTNSPNPEERRELRFGETLLADDSRMFDYDFKFVGVSDVNENYEQLWRDAAYELIREIVETTDHNSIYVKVDGSHLHIDKNVDNGASRFVGLRRRLESIDADISIAFKEYADTHYPLVNAADFIAFQLYQAMQKRQGWQDLTIPERVWLPYQRLMNE